MVFKKLKKVLIKDLLRIIKNKEKVQLFGMMVGNILGNFIIILCVGKENCMILKEIFVELEHFTKVNY